MDDIGRAKTTGRLAGLAYLVIILFSIFGYATLAKWLAGESHTVHAQLAANHTLFTLAFVSSAIGFVAWLVVAALLYRLMAWAGRLSGLLMVIFSVAGTVMNLMALFQLLPLVGEGGLAIDGDALHVIVGNWNRMMLLAQVFSGLWLFPFGWLVVRSQIVPRMLGICLGIGGVAYLTIFATAFLPALNDYAVFRIVGMVTGVAGMIGEFGTCVWLLAKGARASGYRARFAATA